MYQAIRHLPIVTCAVLLGLMTVFLSLLQPIPPAFAQQLTTPAIGISPTQLFFTAQLGGSTPAAQTLTINNTGDVSLRWGVNHDAPWLWHTPGTGTGAGTVTIGVIPGSLPAGTYSGQVTLWPTGAPSVTVPVAFTVMAAPVPPALGVSPTSLSFTAQQGTSNPPAQTMAITNKGGGTLTWSVSDNASWLAPSPASGTGNGVASISVTTGSLTAGTYTGVVTLSATGAPSVTVPVSFTVTAPVPPAIGASPISLSFTAQQGGGNPAPKTVTISNRGGGTLNWSVSHDAAWLGHTPNTGTGVGTVTISVTTGTLKAGTQSGQVTLWPNGATAKPVTIPVSFTVTAAPIPPAIGASPTSLSFTSKQGGSNPSAQTVAITNKGGGTLTWSVSDNASWLAPSPASGTGNGVASISVTTGSLTAGTYNGLVTISATGTPSVTVPVTFTVTAAPIPPAIGASPISLSFTAQQGAGNPAPKTVTISKSGSGTLNWSVSHDAAWLGHTPNTGTGTGTVTISVTTGTLTAGTQSGQVTLWPTGTTAKPVTIPVSFIVTAAPIPPAIGASPTSLSFTAKQGGSNPPAQTMAITNKGGGTLTWSVSDNASWLAPSPASGTGNGVATISVTTGSLTAGTYTGLVTLSATGGPSVNVPVTFIITPIASSASINLSPSSLSYAATQGAANPTNQNISLTTTGGTVNWTVSDNASWLTVNLASGSGSSTLTTSVNTAGVPVGTHNGTITVTAAGTSSKTIAATLTVNAPATSSATLTWKANTESDLAGYKIYRATTAGGYGAPIATLQGNITTSIATGLQVGTTYFFVITSYDTSGNESLRSNEVNKSIY